jgi:hypothetical protein
MPSDKIKIDEYKLSFLVKKLLQLYGYKIKYSKKVMAVKKNLFPVVVYEKNLEGQKNYEEFYDKSKHITWNMIEDCQTMKINLTNKYKTNTIIQKLLKLKSKQEIIRLIQKKDRNFKPKKNTIKVSELI